MKLIRIFFAVPIALLLVDAAVPQVKHQPNQTNVAPSAPAPVLAIESFTHDFGEVKAGTPLRFIFKVKNQGKADLVINNVSPG